MSGSTRCWGGWSAPAPQRPRFLTLYFNLVDTSGHIFGPDSAQVGQAIGKTDQAIGRLLAGLKARGIAANLIIVADHGMAATAPERTILLDDVIDLSAVRLVFDDAVSGIDIPGTPAGQAARSPELLAPHEHMAAGTRPTFRRAITMGPIRACLTWSARPRSAG